jgi:two-component system chemotaxis response regulator CheB
LRSKHIVVIGASAGGLDALRALVSRLPSDFPAPICVVIHTSPQSPALLDQILTRAGHLQATSAKDRQRLSPGTIFVAPPDFHLLVEPGIARTYKGPKENRFRPAIDPLFRTAAQVYGPFAIGVILTGNLDDGTAGLWTIKQLGGVAVVQDPADAMFPSMPASAIAHVRVDYVRPLDEIPDLLLQLVQMPVAAEAGGASPETLEVEVKIAKEHNAIDAGVLQIGEPSSFACPECHGVLLQLKEGGRLRFRCHTGHAYSMDSLLAAIGDGIEDSMWNAIRALEEGSLLMSTMAEHVQTSHNGKHADRLRARAEEARRHSEALRKLVSDREPIEVTSDADA